MRASRLMSILLLLQSRERTTARDLAAHLDVSERTVYRDIQALSAAGIPVYGEAGHEGGYRLVDGYRTRLTGLTPAEADSLFLTGLPAVAADLGLGQAAEHARLKLAAALPLDLSERAARLRDRFHLDAVAWYQAADPIPHLTEVAAAVWHQRRAHMRYVRWESPHEVSRTIEPHGLVSKGGQWYLVARRDEQFRTYRISRLRDVHVLDESFDRATGFDLAAYWQTYLNDFDARRHQTHAVLRLSPTGLHRLPYLAEPAVVHAAHESATPEPDGWTRVTIPVETDDQAVRDILRLGPDAEVLAPVALRARIADTLTAMARRYDGGGSPAARTPAPRNSARQE
ncbi:transcriptional regulator [Kibdelosporangium phytohabitans]|uniref:Transcriptional regulator n=2 Tax=Kibdelosporangium phytohabitans TaxID=860235 RepID=A0A0N9HY26_9PSEU|nr:YafY family protein [Kibdelosporangium phytohabitans]ALG08254.1 transcriptional regulator [Kibdelosporangium phytohabitans]